jgi:hypothetical protein
VANAARRAEDIGKVRQFVVRSRAKFIRDLAKHCRLVGLITKAGYASPYIDAASPPVKGPLRAWHLRIITPGIPKMASLF